MAIIGIGGIGSSVVLYLSGVGIGNLLFIDYDNIELHNLHR